MNNRIIKRIKRLLSKLLHARLKMLNPLLRFYLKKKKGAIGVVYMLHRVEHINPKGIRMNEGMKVSPTFLDKLINDYRRQGFVFLSLDELHDIIANKKKPKKDFVVFTCDDGYMDNFTNAYPIFKKYDVPFCIYIATDFPDRKAFLWWYALEDYLQERNEVVLADGKYYSLKTLEEKELAFRKIRSSLLKMPLSGFEKAFVNYLPGFDKDIYSYVRKYTMSWEQIVTLSKDPLCTIGGHTVKHMALTQMTESEIRNEISEGNKRIKHYIGKEIKHFSYPYGLANENERKIAEEYDFATITTCIEDVITNSNTTSYIPRIMLFSKEFQ